MSLTIETQTADSETTLKLVGVIDEHADLSAFSEAASARLVLNLEGVTRINSFGVSRWIKAIGSVPPQVSVICDRMSVVMASQVTMIANFLGRAKVRSFYAPYYDPSTDEELDELLTPSETLRSGPPARTSPTGGPLLFDDVAEGFFASLVDAAE